VTLPSSGAPTTVIAQNFNTTDLSDAIVVAYNLVVRNGSSGPCSVVANLVMDGGAYRQTVIQMPTGGVYSGGQTIPFLTSFVGTHSVVLQALTFCSNIDVDVTNWSGGQYGSTMTTMVLKQ
jgi:hypothetical protein